MRHPVLRLDFGGGVFGDPDGLRADVDAQLEAAEERTGMRTRSGSLPARLRRLIAEMHRRSGRRVVLLVDEYDKPILDALDRPELSRANRDFLRGLYANVKVADAHLHLTLLTGVSRFSKVSLFSGVNNLIDITLDPHFSDVCGYTDADVPAGLPQPGGAPEPQRRAAAAPGAGRVPADRQQRPAGAAPP